MTGGEQRDERPDAGVAVADSFTIDFCDHGYGLLSLFKEGEAEPFAVAYFAPSAAYALARHLATNVGVGGSA